MTACTSRCQQIPSLRSYLRRVFCCEPSSFLIQTPAFFLSLLPVLLVLALFLFFPPHQGRAAHRECESQDSCPSRLLHTGPAHLSSVGLSTGLASTWRHSGVLVLSVGEPAVGYLSAIL